MVDNLSSVIKDVYHAKDEITAADLLDRLFVSIRELPSMAEVNIDTEAILKDVRALHECSEFGSELKKKVERLSPSLVKPWENTEQFKAAKKFQVTDLALELLSLTTDPAWKENMLRARVEQKNVEDISLLSPLRSVRDYTRVVVSRIHDRLTEESRGQADRLVEILT